MTSGTAPGATRVLWLSSETPDRHGQGGQRRQYHLLRELAERGHRITVLVPRSVQDDASIRPLVHQVMRPRVAIRGIPVPFAAARIRRRVRRREWDAVVVSHLESMWMLPTEGLTTPPIVDLHNVVSAWTGAEPETRRRAALDESDALARGATLLVCSELERHRFLAVHPGEDERVVTVPLGVDAAEWPDERWDRAEPVVALFGTWSWEPNRQGLAWFLDEVWPRVTERMPKARALVAGGSPRGVDSWPAGSRFVGRVDDLARFTASATVVAVPVFNGVGASVKFGEALASGAAVVATVDGSSAFPDAIAFVSDDAATWADAIVDRLESRALDPAPAPTRQQALEHFTWAAASEPLDDLLRVAAQRARAIT